MYNSEQEEMKLEFGYEDFDFDFQAETGPKTESH